MKNKKHNLSLEDVNNALNPISKQIEAKMLDLQNKYNFSLDYSFKPISLEELKNFKP